MQFSSFRSRMIFLAGPLLLAGGCETPWYTMEPYTDAVIAPTNPYTGDLSRQKLAETVNQPSDMQPFFADQAEYMGDQDNYRYVHVREMSEFWGFLGECVYKIPASDWPMAHPTPLTLDATKWQDVTWMNGEGPAGVTQNAFLHITPRFPLGAPATQPAWQPTNADTGTTSPANPSATAPTDATSATNSQAPASQTAPAPSAPADTAPAQTTPVQTAPSQSILNK